MVRSFFSLADVSHILQYLFLIPTYNTFFGRAPIIIIIIIIIRIRLSHRTSPIKG
jgi:hypothetical protein